MMIIQNQSHTFNASTFYTQLHKRYIIFFSMKSDLVISIWHSLILQPKTYIGVNSVYEMLFNNIHL